MLDYSFPEEKQNYDTYGLDPMFDEAVKLILGLGKASSSLIQRRLKLGYARAARLLDQVEHAGIIGPAIGSHPRKILIRQVDGVWQYTPPKKLTQQKDPMEEKLQINWKKTKYAEDKSDYFGIDLGVDEKKNKINLNLERYGNLLIIGSQFTSVVDLLNGILATSLAKYSPEELRILVIDGLRGDLIVPNEASHMLTPLIVEPDKAVSALKWAVCEIERRSKNEGEDNKPKVLILINSLNQILNFSPAEVEDNLYGLIAQGRKYGFYFVIGTDYLNPRFSKLILVNTPTKLVFKATDKKIARENGIPESADLTSPDEAILETMYDGKKKITINKTKVKEIYREIYE